MRVVLDTNVLIDGGADDYSAAAKLIDAVIDEELTAIVTPAVVREYSFKMPELVTDEAYRERLNDFIAAAEEVEAGSVTVQIDDRDDRKFLEAAVGGAADILVTTDRHLLQIGEVGTTRIMTPPEAWVRFETETESSGEWKGWLQGLGIGQ